MSRPHRLLAPLLIVVCCWGAPVVAQIPQVPDFSQAALGGVVTDNTGRIIDNVEIVIVNVATGQEWRRNTGPFGDYIVYDLPPGRYVVRIDPPPYYARTERDVKHGYHTAVDLTVDQTGLGGVVRDATGYTIEGATVQISNVETGQHWRPRTGELGDFIVWGVPPGRYDLLVNSMGYMGRVLNVEVKSGFRTKVDLVVFVATAESVTVNSQAVPASITTDPRTGATLVSRAAIETIPLSSGRTLQSFQALVPGIVFTESTGTLFQFTAAGQRRSTNRMVIDGISADLAIDPIGPGLGQVGGGTLPATSTLGGTQTLVPLAAIEEIQIRTTGASPEYQYAPGAKTSIVTRAGSERLTASAFTDVRPDSWAARDWFQNAGRVPRRETRAWTTGASLGGPILRRRFFGFGTWERQQIDRPITTTIRVPSMSIRERASPAVRPILDAFPQPNGRDLSNGLAEFSHRFPSSSGLNAFSVRMDAAFWERHRVFARVSAGKSSGDQLLNEPALPSFSFSATERTRTNTVTIGWLAMFKSATNDLRANVSTHDASVMAGQAPYGDAQPLPMTNYVGTDVRESDASLLVRAFPGPGGLMFSGRTNAGSQRQVQIVDTWTLARGGHEWRVGADFRHVLTASDAAPYRYSYMFNSPTALSLGRASLVLLDYLAPARVRRDALALFAQNTWRATDKLTVTYGLHYRVQPAPVSRTTSQPTLLEHETLPDAHPRPVGSRLWKMSWTNVAPRVSATYDLSSVAGRETTLHAGWGLTYDELGSPGTIPFGRAYPYVSSHVIGTSEGLPIAPERLLPEFPAPPGPGSEFYAFPENLRSPRTYEWQIGGQQAFGRGQRLGLSYVGTAGRDLIYWRAYGREGQHLHAYSNDATSDYHALLVEYVRRPWRGLQGRVAYTWSHAIDTDSGESSIFRIPPPALMDPSSNRGSADYDRRHVLYATMSYRLPTPRLTRLTRSLFSDWQIDTVGMVRSGAPVGVTVDRDLGFGVSAARPDFVAGVPQWLETPLAPTGRTLNPAAFVVPDEQRQGTLGRNTLRASPLRQIDLSVSRSIRLGQRTAVRVRIDAFNVLNIPNFGPPEARIGTSMFGQSTRSYAEALGTGSLTRGGLTPVQQVGGPRAVQFAVRFDF